MLRLFRKRNGQIAPFLTIVIVIIILAIGATMTIGRLVTERVRLSNTVDSTLISTGSDFARSLNLIRQIHFRMLLNYISMQVMLLARGIWSSKWEAYQALLLPSIEGILRSKEMYEQAEELAEKAPESLRSSVYDRILGGLVDEGKAFKTTERDIDGDGMLEKVLDYESYLKEKTSFQATYLKYKKDHKEDWHEKNVYSYAWYKNAKKKCVEWDPLKEEECIKYEYSLPKGNFTQGDPVKRDQYEDPYESYLRVALGQTPNKVRIKAQKMVLFFLWTCGTSVCPGFIPLPWAWISRLTISPSSEIGADVTKLPFRTFPLFMPEKDCEGKANCDPLEDDLKKELRHKTKVSITGGLWSGYDIKLRNYQ